MGKYAPRTFRITKRDLEKFGLAVGCPGCRAANRGSTVVGHTDENAKRIMEELEKAEYERIERETERFFECLEVEEKENKKKKAKPEQTKGAGNQAAALSSGGGRAEVQRSRGGVTLELTNKRKASEDQQEQPAEKKTEGVHG